MTTTAPNLPMLKPLKILDLGSAYGMQTAHMFTPWVTRGLAMVIRPSWADGLSLIKDSDLVCFGGGADIHPSLYGSTDVASWVSIKPSGRDVVEQQAFTEAVKRKKPILGICRGAQLACALAGGKLIQDVTSHAGGSHNIDTQEGRSRVISSAHHQMMYVTPNLVEHTEVIAWCEPRSHHYLHDIPDFVPPVVEPEILLFKNVNALAVQGHPEFMNPTHSTVCYVRQLISQYLLNNLVETEDESD